MIQNLVRVSFSRCCKSLVNTKILDDGVYMKVVENVVNREIVVVEVLSSELSNCGALS
jgi:hypothetical protein